MTSNIATGEYNKPGLTERAYMLIPMAGIVLRDTVISSPKLALAYWSGDHAKQAELEAASDLRQTEAIGELFLRHGMPDEAQDMMTAHQERHSKAA